MLATVVRSVARQSRRNPLFFILHLCGLALGIGIFLTLSLLVRYEYAFNATLPDVDRLARVDSHWTMPGNAPNVFNTTTFYALAFLQDDFPEIETATKLEPTTLTVRHGNARATFDGAMTDSNFFKVFGLPLLHGNAADALADPDGLVLSAHTAVSLFGTTDVLGQTVVVGRAGTMKAHVITGVLAREKDPNFLNTTDLLVPFSPQDMQTESCFSAWGNDCGSLYFKLHTPRDITSMNRRMQDFVTRRVGGDAAHNQIGPHPEKKYALSVVPLRETHFQDFSLQRTEDGVDRNVVDGIGVIGILALALACANAVNLATARSVLRAREVALRKTLGGTRNVLFFQFMGESLLIAALAGIIGLAVCELLLPEIASLTGENIVIRYGFVACVLPPVIAVSSFASGFYPAYVLAGYRPATVLAAAKMPSGGRSAARLRDMLIAVQFAIAITIVVCMLIINRQTEFVRNADHGYVRAGLLIGDEIPQDDIALQRRMIDTLRKIPGVSSAGFGELSPHPDNEARSTYVYAAPQGPVSVHLLRDVVGTGYQEAYRPRLLAGRWFDPIHGQDDAPTGDDRKSHLTNVVINATAASRFGFTTPDSAIGKIVSEDSLKFAIIGVISDIRFESPRQPIYPEIIAFNTLTANPFSGAIPAVRFRGVTASEMESRLNHAWESLLPDSVGNFQTTDDRMTSYYRGDERRGTIFTFGAATALLIACLGLYGLSSFAATRRFHEVGIRKTLGATAAQILFLLLRDFLRPVIAACGLACPIAWIIMRRWLSGFDERIWLSPSYFLISLAGALGIASLTVLGQSLRIARAEPARALRTE